MSFSGNMLPSRRGRDTLVRPHLTYIVYRSLGGLAGRLSPRAGYWMSGWMAALLWALSPGLRRTVQSNLGHVLGPAADEADVQAAARQAFVNIMKGHYDLFRVNRLSEEEIMGLTRVDRWDRITAALEKGKGVVLTTAHFGNIDVVGQLPQAYGIPLTGPVEHIQPERLFQYTLSLRTSHGMRLVPTDGPMMELYRALRRGEIVGLPCDRALGDHTREVEFFGAPARLTDGAVRVAHRTGAALVPAFVLRLPDDTFLVQVEPEIELPHTGDREADITAGMEMVVDAMERHISRHPEQWLVAVPVWPLD